MHKLLASVVVVASLFQVVPSRAASLVHQAQVQRGAAVQAPALERIDDDDDDGSSQDTAAGDNPWDTVLWAPMYVPFPWSALLDGYVPWGRASWVKNVTGACFMLCGGCMIGIFPFTLLFALISLLLAVLALAMSVYVFFTSGFKGGCCGVAGRSADVTNNCFSVFNGIMCLSYCLCTPWFGFKLIQRGWYAIRTDIEPKPAKRAREHQAPAEQPAPEQQPQPEPAPAQPEAEDPAGQPAPGTTGARGTSAAPVAVAF